MAESDIQPEQSKIEITLKDGTLVNIQPSPKLLGFYQNNPERITALLTAHLYNGLGHVYVGEELSPFIARIYRKAKEAAVSLIEETMRRDHADRS